MSNRRLSVVQAVGSPQMRTPDTSSVDLRSSLIRKIVADGQECQARIRRFRREGLAAWLEQAERLHAIHNVHGIIGSAFEMVADEIGLDSSTAYGLLQLHPFADRLLAECDQQAAADPKFRYPGWRTALAMMTTEGTSSSPAEFQSPHRLQATWSHGSDEWATPESLFRLLDDIYGFDVDVAATLENTKCREFWGKADDGLKQDWLPGRTYWANPPYSQSGKWVKKAHDAAAAGATVVALLANRSSTRWYRDFVVPSAFVIQLFGRTTFGGKLVDSSSAPFASIICIWPRPAGECIRHLCKPVDVGLLEIPKGSQGTSGKRGIG